VSARSTLSTILGKIPYAALSQMVSNFVNIHLPQYPCIDEPVVHNTLANILRFDGGDTDTVLKSGVPSESGLTHFDYFLVFIILAVSSLTLTWRDDMQARAASDGFLDCAVQHLTLAPEVTELQRLQTLLLLAHYGHLNPVKVDNWTCIWKATRIVMEMGLQKQPPPNCDPSTIRMRNKLFWCAYGMERSLSTLLRLPLTIDQDTITAPPDLDAAAGIKQSVANHLYIHRAVETELHRVLWLQDVSAQGEHVSLDAWQRNILARLEVWHGKAKEYSRYDMLPANMIQYGFFKLRLFRPSPRLPPRNPEAQKLCFDACTILVEDYQQQVRKRRLFYPWLAVHILFEAAVVMLEACWALRDLPTMRAQAKVVLSGTLPDGLGVLAKIAETWPEATLCNRFLAPLVDEVGKRFRGRDLSVLDASQSKAETGLTNRLRGLFLPDVPLLQNADSRPALEQVAVSNVGVTLGLPSLHPNFQEMDWDAYWQGVQSMSPFWEDIDANTAGLMGFGELNATDL
jgi:hypothetical protein